jgi:hypothetical protein
LDFCSLAPCGRTLWGLKGLGDFLEPLKMSKLQIGDALRSQLSWTHYRMLMRIAE